VSRLLQLGTFIVFAALLVKTLKLGWYGKPAVLPPSTVEIGNAIFTRFVFPFEVISLVLLAAMIGAIFIAKKEGPS
jgi:NADH-quinone oxidoreductase subunit J